MRAGKWNFTPLLRRFCHQLSVKYLHFLSVHHSQSEEAAEMQRRPRSTRLPFRVRILYILQLNFRCHRWWKERHIQTKQRIDAHRNASSSKIMPNIATLFKATTTEKVTGTEVFFPHSLQSITSLSLLLPFYIPMLKYLCRRPFALFFCE